MLHRTLSLPALALLLLPLTFCAPARLPAAEPIPAPAEPLPHVGAMTIEPAPIDVPDAAPPGAEGLDLTLEIGDGVVIAAQTAVLARPMQPLKLAVHAAPADGRPRLLPPLANAAEGRGPGGARLEIAQRIAWDWTAGQALDLTDDVLLWRTPPSGGTYEVACRVWQTQSVSSPTDDPTRVGHSWGRAAFPVLVGETFEPDQLSIQGFAVGVYPNPSTANAPDIVREHADRYQAPKYLFKVTPETAKLNVTPNFTLGDFAMDATRFGDRQYIALDPQLLARLEQIAVELRRRHADARLRILRAFVTPLAADLLRRDGARITEFSRHLYGDAAVLVVDADGDNRMDDLNADGTVDALDAVALGEICEAVEARSTPGGLGIYGISTDPTLPDTPHVQVDLRGVRARWEVME